MYPSYVGNIFLECSVHLIKSIISIGYDRKMKSLIFRIMFLFSVDLVAESEVFKLNSHPNFWYMVTLLTFEERQYKMEEDKVGYWHQSFFLAILCLSNGCHNVSFSLIIFRIISVHNSILAESIDFF